MRYKNKGMELKFLKRPARLLHRIRRANIMKVLNRKIDQGLDQIKRNKEYEEPHQNQADEGLACTNLSDEGMEAEG